ncbi:DUF983 domain-containing protein [Mucilaginibacter gotjawali]|uniref:Uncharacterized protein n=2 Tax=Mucilaginibacter gotjawali TaxID=1550579 RepID=A0A0X8X576_9SPHI|nr:DUF983 domain-containing protein [Mucilaginibacter gotjawali]MBB3058667.1 uncharacterized protein (DUF983 family) [Mucilaginibacter gotjawali]BAU55864.1 hypothetical protein MgSA37_04056 [Mucilaginibacter gotjawali]
MNKQVIPLPAMPAIMHARCPRCRRGEMFTAPMYGLKSQGMNKTCPHCGLTFEREPGYFYVSMLISYAMFVAEMIGLAVAISVLTGGSKNPWLYISVILTIGVVLSPFNFRYSRVILLYWLTPGLHYRPEMSGDNYSSNK